VAEKALLQNLAALTGLPQDAVQNELRDLVIAAGFNPDTLTLEQVRAVLADYLQDTLLAAKRELDNNFAD
jgi:hypothetical protein